MIFTWLRNRRRRKILAQPFPADWEEILRGNVRHFWQVSDEQRADVRQRVQIIVAEKHWEGSAGTQVTDEMKVTIAGMASFLVLGVPDYYFDSQQTIIVRPDTYRPSQPHSQGGWVDEDQRMEGEAYQFGPIILSWQDVLAGCRHDDDGHNLVLHEFAHFLDGVDGSMGGTPPLTDRKFARRWEEVMQQEYQQLCQAAEQGWPSLLSYYGSKNRAEFFAVSTECFFELAVDLNIRHPELYDVLRQFYQLDPATW